MTLQQLDKKTAKAWIKAASKLAPAASAAAPSAPAAAEAAPAEKPKLQIGGLKHDPAVFHQGEEVKSTVTVTNNGAAAATIKLKLYVNEALADSQSAAVKPGKSKDVTFKWTAQEKNKLNIRGELA
jgi:uncharacterized repeat protein (TIGR01451 family)